MEKREFLLMFYFNIYKDFPIASRDNFRRYFKHRHGEYKDLNILIELIERYQLKIYECTIQGNYHHVR